MLKSLIWKGSGQADAKARLESCAFYSRVTGSNQDDLAKSRSRRRDGEKKAGRAEEIQTK